jgi:hypothetical protein
MNYTSLFKENAPLINVVFTKPSDLRKVVTYFLSQISSSKLPLEDESSETDVNDDSIREALNYFITNYVDPAIENEVHKDATATNTSEFKIFQAVINNQGDISKSKNDLRNSIDINKYSRIFNFAELSYSYLVSNYRLYKNK